MIDDKTIKEFTVTFRRVLTLVSLLQNNLDDFKRLEYHKYVHVLGHVLPAVAGKNKRHEPDMRSDAAALLNAMQVYLLKSKNKTNSRIWGQIMHDMTREQIDDINLLLDEVRDLADIDQVTQVIRDCKKRDNVKA
jgi:hypothetical protein